MRKTILIIISILAMNAYGQNKTHWIKKFYQGTLYISFVEDDKEYGTHIKKYNTKTKNAGIYPLKYTSGKYKFKLKNGWSNSNFISFLDGKLIYTTPENGPVEMTKTDWSDIPAEIKNINKYPKKYIIERNKIAINNIKKRLEIDESLIKKLDALLDKKDLRGIEELITSYPNSEYAIAAKEDLKYIRLSDVVIAKNSSNSNNRFLSASDFMNKRKFFWGLEKLNVQYLDGLSSKEVETFMRLISNFPKLSSLEITLRYNTPINQKIFNEIFKIKQLKKFKITFYAKSESIFSQIDFSGLANFTLLESIFLWGNPGVNKNHILDAPKNLIDGVSGLKNLKSLKLYGIKMNGETIDLNWFKKLEFLSLYYCNTINIRDSIENLNYIKNIYISKTEISNHNQIKSSLKKLVAKGIGVTIK